MKPVPKSLQLSRFTRRGWHPSPLPLVGEWRGGGVSRCRGSALRCRVPAYPTPLLGGRLASAPTLPPYAADRENGCGASWRHPARRRTLAATTKDQSVRRRVRGILGGILDRGLAIPRQPASGETSAGRGARVVHQSRAGSRES